ncbi:DUF2101 family protein [Methanobacterium spitsbergense]|uniref:DUF2101 family protein n=1 Tax=Methanobacterium spitsbergense TaxID=2874285 RepID=A0A8T5UXH1_9EURY|nr:DUF2101 family protein [Methanobacterium spitsbergense]MBZ2165389.1 DUF2101 family protein [Methanobacterium spitsbergense]
MSLFNKLGYYIIKLFSITGMLILSIPKIPEKLRNINSKDIREKMDTENLKDNISRLRDDVGFEEKLSQIRDDERIFRITGSEKRSKSSKKSEPYEEKSEKSDSSVVMIGGAFTSAQKERTVLTLQILSAAFVVVSILSIFHFISTIIYIPLGVVIVGYILYLLYNKIKLMYKNDFNAYRDFFLMYVAVGIILALVNTNSNFVMAYSFQLLPSLTILIFAVVAVLAVFLIFRIRYYRNFTYGTVIEAGKKTAYVKVEYDIRSNVKPDIYIVENNVGVVEGDYVKLQLEQKLMSMSGNKPISIIETVNIL